MDSTPTTVDNMPSISGRGQVEEGYLGAMLSTPAYLPCSLGIAEGVVADHVEFRVSNQHPVVAGMLMVTGIAERPDHAELFVGMARMAFTSEVLVAERWGVERVVPSLCRRGTQGGSFALARDPPQNHGFVGAVLFPRLPD